MILTKSWIFSFAKIAFDVEDVFLIFFEDNGDICSKEIMATILFLFFIALRAVLVILIFFDSLTLVDRKLLGLLCTEYISKGSISGLIFLKVFILFFCRSISLETLDINFADT